MRSLSSKILIYIGIVSVFYSAFLLYHTYSLTNTHVNELVEQQASMVLKFDLAIRKYIAQYVRPIMYDLLVEDEFVPEVMSTSFVARSIFDEVREDFPEYIIKFSSDNPRNPSNQAGPEELKIIKLFNNSPDLKRWSGKIAIGGKMYYAKFSARRMKKSCLRCHGDPSDAPASLLKKYGSTVGFHRPVGEIIGLDTIAIPMTKITKQLWSEVIKAYVESGFGLLLFFLSMAIIMKLLITDRLSKIARHFLATVKKSNYAGIEPIKIEGKDEISDLAFSFNILSDKLQNFYSSLEAKVRERTEKLKKTNIQLKQEVADRKRAERELRQAKEEAEDGQQAIDAYRRKQYDLILMDIQMPKMDGFKATEAIRNLEDKLDETGDGRRSRSTPIIALTAHAVKGHRESCLEKGMDDYISKPLKKAELLAMVDRWVSGIDSYPSHIDDRANEDGGAKQEKSVDSQLPQDGGISKDDTPMKFEKALKEFEGDKDLLTSVLDGFLSKVRSQTGTIRQAISRGDKEVVRREAHAIKGGAANLTAAPLSEVASELERIGKSNALAEGVEVIERLEKEFHRLESFVKGR